MSSIGLLSPTAFVNSDSEREQFLALQARLPALFESFEHDPSAPRTIVVVPGLSLDTDGLSRIAGVRHYEQRMLSLLMWLRLVNTRVVFITSEPVDPVIVDYYLSFLSGVPTDHARSRLTLLSTYDASSTPLAGKILDRPRLIERIRAAIGDPSIAHLTVFNATPLEVSLATRLGVPLYACDPELSSLGSKSGSRELFRAAGVEMPRGEEHLRDEADIAGAIARLKRDDPALRRAVIKLDEGFSGDGNAVFDFGDVAPTTATTRWIQDALATRLKPEASGETVPGFLEKFRRMHGIVERWIDGRDKRSPSVQMRISPLRTLELISTHDQLLGGPSGQVFLGATFPACAEYRLRLHDAGMAVGAELLRQGAMGRFAVDFVSVREGDAWRHYAIEVNLRKGGTTLPYQMMQFLTDGTYDTRTGDFRTPIGQTRCYYATDNLINPAYRRLIPQDLIDILVEHHLHFDEKRQRGVVFTLIGALSEYGKLGLVCIDADAAGARALFDDTVAVLDRATAES